MSHTRTVISLKSENRRAKIVENCPNFRKTTKWREMNEKNGRLVTVDRTAAAPSVNQSRQLPVDH